MKFIENNNKCQKTFSSYCKMCLVVPSGSILEIRKVNFTGKVGPAGAHVRSKELQ